MRRRAYGLSATVAAILLLGTACGERDVTLLAQSEHSLAVACTEWAEGTSYTAGQVVTYLGATYTARVAHTAAPGANWNPRDTASLWLPGGSCGGGADAGGGGSDGGVGSGTDAGTSTAAPWAANKQYAVGDVVSYNGVKYQCISAHTSLPGWEPPNVPTLWKVAPADPGGGGGPTTPFCAPAWVATKIYSKGKVVGYNSRAYRALADVHGIKPDDTIYNMWELVGVPDDNLCPVSIPNNINYGQPSVVTGNPRAGSATPSGPISAAHPVSGTGTGGTRGGIDPSTDPGGNHPGFDADTGARVSKLPPGTLPLQHNVYQLSAGQEVVEYLGDWAIYGRRFDFNKLPVKNVHRLVYGFAGICYPAAKNTQDPGFPTTAPAAVNRTCKQSNLPDGAMAVADFEAAFLRVQPGQSGGKVTGTESMYDLDPKDVAGVFGVLYKLRQENPHLKLDLSVGGWTLSEGFPWMAYDPTRRKAFVDSVVRFLEQFDFDGIDIDWEYPGADGAVPGMSRPDDPQNYLQLLKDLRAGLDWLSRKTGKQYRLSSAISAVPSKLRLINWTETSKYLDRLYLMTYDFSGAWERQFSHHTPLFTNPNFRDAQGNTAPLSVDAAVQTLKQEGAPANKIMIGIANYHRAKAINLSDITEYTNGLRGSSTFGNLSATGVGLVLGIAGVGSWEAGVVEGYDLYQNFLDKDLKPKNGYRLYTDKASNADYLVHPLGSFITIETPRTVALKASYAKVNGLAGVFGWQIEQDNGYNLNALNHVLGNALGSSLSDAKPQDQIAVCGENVTAAECAQLNQSIK
ncbi:glycosyl hydrolase family 18 protein [Vitiosangium sp. GDMCC 1.1324]|uniref:glycosyl hydrolase family 18 protein n=1 Tax=Vitiosangium sp. (strain GDMCC 1.1324) TaxID=2138576 RepID=UPI000D33E8F6|nr:glycosyl hydrolase family 18 protein [Vitiosangium sp. GDMCC 1.1324]PTL84612.1 chitinase [Vitiosangium sp. GDMCC 1.1324]